MSKEALPPDEVSEMVHRIIATVVRSVPIEEPVTNNSPDQKHRRSRRAKRYA